MKCCDAKIARADTSSVILFLYESLFLAHNKKDIEKYPPHSNNTRVNMLTEATLTFKLPTRSSCQRCMRGVHNGTDMHRKVVQSYCRTELFFFYEKINHKMAIYLQSFYEFKVHYGGKRPPFQLEFQVHDTQLRS